MIKQIKQYDQVKGERPEKKIPVEKVVTIKYLNLNKPIGVIFQIIVTLNDEWTIKDYQINQNKVCFTSNN